MTFEEIPFTNILLTFTHQPLAIYYQQDTENATLYVSTFFLSRFIAKIFTCVFNHFSRIIDWSTNDDQWITFIVVKFLSYSYQIILLMYHFQKYSTRGHFVTCNCAPVSYPINTTPHYLNNHEHFFPCHLIFKYSLKPRNKRHIIQEEAIHFLPLGSWDLPLRFSSLISNHFSEHYIIAGDNERETAEILIDFMSVIENLHVLWIENSNNSFMHCPIFHIQQDNIFYYSKWYVLIFS